MELINYKKNPKVIENTMTLSGFGNLVLMRLLPLLSLGQACFTPRNDEKMRKEDPGTFVVIYDKSGAWHKTCHNMKPIKGSFPDRIYIDN